MAFKYIKEDASGGFLLEDGTSLLLLDDPSATWAEDLDTSHAVDTSGGNVQLRLRIGVENSGTAIGATAFKIRCSRNSGAYFDVTASSTYVKTFGTAYYGDGDDVPQIITSGTYQADNNAAEGNTGAFTLTAGLAVATKFEAEIALEFIAADLSNADTLDFRITQSDATVLDTYTQTARATITAAAAAYTLDAAIGSYTITGADALDVAARILNGAAGSYVVSGVDALFSPGRFLAAAAGSYTITGQDAQLFAARILNAAPGTYAVSGLDSLLVAQRALDAATGSYIVTGADALLVAQRMLAAGAGSYLITGADALLVAARMLDAEPGSYAITGADAILLYTPLSPPTEFDLLAEPGVYAITGADALNLATRIINAAPGAYAVTGANAQDIAARTLDAEPGSYDVSGASATLLYTSLTPPSGAILREKRKWRRGSA